MNNSFQTSVKKSQFSYKLKSIVGTTCVLAACASFAGGILLCNWSNNYFDIEQMALNDKLTNHFKAATSSSAVVLARQQVAEAIEEIDQYTKLHPLAENSNDFETWYTNLVAIKEQLDLAEQVVNSNATGLEKLQAESIATARLEKFAKIKSINFFGGEIVTAYNVPDSIPIRLNSRQEAITKVSWLLPPLTIILPIILIILGIKIIPSDEL